MSYLNSVSLIGFVGADPEQRQARSNSTKFAVLFDATQGTKPYRKAYIENTKKFLEKADIEWNSPILEWGTNLTRLNQS